MKKLFVIIAAFAAAASLRADTSYLLFQGPFGPGSSEATFKWQVNYGAGLLLNGQDLLNSVFGTPTLNGTYTDGFSSVYDYYSTGNSTQGAGFIDFNPDLNQLSSPFLISVTLGAPPVVQALNYSTGWNYYVAGGGSAQSYPNVGAWTYSDDGTTTRTLANGSYDAWVFGNTFPAAAINGAGNSPSAANFSGATVINAVPEPASAALLLSAAGMLLLRRRRA